MAESHGSEYGQATLEPTKDVVAGTYNTWNITYTVGELGMDDGSTIKIAGNMTSDWGTPQFEEPSADNYAVVETSGEATIGGSYNPKGHVRPWKHTVTIDVFDGSLDKGDTISLTLGDRSGGSLGHRAQSFPEDDFRIAVLVDAFGTGEFVQLSEELTFDVVPGAADSLTAVVPSTAEPDEPVSVSIRVEDYWGNTATDYDGSFTATSNKTGVETSVEVQNGTGTADMPLSETGTHHLKVTADTSQLETTTNPVRVERTGENLFWGDIHGQSGETVGTGTIWEYLTYARDNAFLDFTSHAANDFQITDEFWTEIQDTIQDFHNPGGFVTFLCYEWSANTSRGGDHNVYFKGDEADIHRSSSWQIEDGREKHNGLHPVEDLYNYYEGREDVLIIPHQGGRPATLDVLDPGLSPFVEIVSVWGIFEWLGQDALEEGYHVGFVGGSDDHTNRVGASYPTNQTDFNIKGGLMAVRADGLSRDDLWQAFKQRRCYATTGARIILETTINSTGMGGTVAVENPPEIDVAVEGTAPLSRISLFRGSEKVAERALNDGTRAVELRWSGARSRTRHKVQDWSGGLSVDCGQVAGVEEFGFDHPEQGVIHQTDTSIRWDGSTSGNYQGIRVQFDAPDDATVTFSSAPVSTEFTVGELDGRREIDAGHLDRQLEIRPVGTPTQKQKDITFVDDTVDTGTHPYFVRVSQVDGEMAWSSPILVNME